MYCECPVSDMERLDRAIIEAWKHPESMICHKCHLPFEPPNNKSHRPI